MPYIISWWKEIIRYAHIVLRIIVHQLLRLF